MACGGVIKTLVHMMALALALDAGDGAGSKKEPSGLDERVDQLIGMVETLTRENAGMREMIANPEAARAKNSEGKEMLEGVDIPWDDIAEKVVNLEGENPCGHTCSNYYEAFNKPHANFDSSEVHHDDYQSVFGNIFLQIENSITDR